MASITAARLYLEDLVTSKEKIQLITFGQPRTWDYDAAEALKRSVPYKWRWIYACAGTGIGLNFLLLYLIFTDSNHGRDGYRRMLAIVSCYNIYYAVVHCVMEVGILIDSSGFLAFSYSCARFGYWVSFFAIQLYNVFFTTLTMRPSPERDEISRVALLQRYNLSIDQLGYLGPVYKLTNTSGSWVYVWPSIISTMSTVTLQVIVYCATCVCGVQLYIFVRKALVSNRSKSMNMQLLRLLMIQAITPLIFEYIPFFATLFGGFIG
ncbi:unnamed protein product, partial [Mesorhabditis belari]|uniref:Fungal lipase-type domain-containing protein n=1 Tax=Mesorhabditis belari TaxID=2138241 RepID=A0AAF3FK19_9BILA